MLVKLLAKTDQIDAAVSKANDLILLKPHDDESWVVMADIYYQQDLIESGLQYLEQGLQLIPDSTMIAYRKLVYLYGLKKFNEAEDWLETIFDSTQTEDLMEIETLDPSLCDWMPYALKRKNN